MRTPRQCAILLSILLDQSEQTRARISQKTVRLCGKRKRLHSAFTLSVIEEIEDFGWALFELPSGSFGAVRIDSIEAAKPVTKSKHMPTDVEDELKKKSPDWEMLEGRVTPLDLDNEDAGE